MKQSNTKKVKYGWLRQDSHTTKDRDITKTHLFIKSLAKAGEYLSGPSDILVLCGDVEGPRGFEKALRLCTHGPQKNMGVNISGIGSHQIRQLSPLSEDLVMIASYLVAASRIFREQTEDRDPQHGQHCFRFVIGVKCVEFWLQAKIRQTLNLTLGLLSKSEIKLDFVPLNDCTANQIFTLQRRSESPIILYPVEEAALLSGGLDSFGSAVDQIVGKQKNMALVSHCSSRTTWNIQQNLAKNLGTISQNHLPHITVRIVPFDNQYLKERPQRIDFLLYLALAAAVANIVGSKSIQLPRNGISSLGLRTSKKQKKKPTSVTHPGMLASFSRLLSMVSDQAIEVCNPLAFNTRVEVVKNIETLGTAYLIGNTVSCQCSSFSDDILHCGVCSQCIDRRVAVLANNLESNDTKYPVSLFSRVWDRKENRNRLMHYFVGARRLEAIGNINEFQKIFFEDGDNKVLVQAVYDLHKRFGKDVRMVGDKLSTALKEQAVKGVLRTDKSLNIISINEIGRSSYPPPALDDMTAGIKVRPLGDNVFLRLGEYWMLRFEGRDKITLGHVLGLGYMQYLLRHPVSTYTAYMMLDLAKGRTRSERPLAISLDADQSAIDCVRERRMQLIKERDKAIDSGDIKTAHRCDADIALITQYLNYESGLGGKSRKENKSQKKARDSVSGAIRWAIDKIAAHDNKLAEHLTAYIVTGFFLEYRCGHVVWET